MSVIIFGLILSTEDEDGKKRKKEKKGENGKKRSKEKMPLRIVSEVIPWLISFFFEFLCSTKNMKMKLIFNPVRQNVRIGRVCAVCRIMKSRIITINGETIIVLLSTNERQIFYFFIFNKYVEIDYETMKTFGHVNNCSSNRMCAECLTVTKIVRNSNDSPAISSQTLNISIWNDVVDTVVW